MTCRVLTGDCRLLLKTLPSGSVHCLLTSPPYYNLRSYLPNGHPDKALEIGQESSPEEYVAALVAVFREARRVLHDSGVAFVNLGDSYGSNKQLQMIPARVALALQADGWILRSEIIFAKKNPMPESCKDRPTSAHEKVFMLAKQPRYYFDSEAVKEPSIAPGSVHVAKLGQKNEFTKREIPKDNIVSKATRNLRNVWHIASEPSGLQHFAIMPSALAAICIKAGTSEKGCCPHCGAGWVREVEKERIAPQRSGRWKATGEAHRNDIGRKGGFYPNVVLVGWRPSCGCPEHQPVPATILDPFAGVGTTGLVADRLGRNAVLIELHPQNMEMAADRVRQDAGLFAEVSHGVVPVA